ncbi:MAG: TauD/TfdA family dioxygenase [Pseudomonadota bacterium]
MRAMIARPLTPDFYDYAWQPIRSVELRGDFVELGWDDGTTLTAYCAWLRENIVQAGFVDPATREATLDPADLTEGLTIAAARKTDEGALTIVWADDVADSLFHPGWLYHVAASQHLPSAFLPDQSVWTAQTLKEPPTRTYEDTLQEPAFGEWVEDLLRFGIAKLTQCPPETDFIKTAIERIGPLRDTNFGLVWDVIAEVELAGTDDANSTANTRLRLGPHTDLPTRETPPGFQVLHCLRNEAGGGASTYADGYAVAAELEATHPEYYELLTTRRWVFFNRGPGIDHRWSGPLIDRGAPGAPLTLRAFYPVRAFPDMPPADVPCAYAALRCFSRLAAAERFQLRLRMQPGDLVAFDNRRILHGRDAFDAGGVRHLRGVYIDHDEVRSFARNAARRRASQHARA